MTPFYYPGALQFLLQEGADANAVDSHGNTPLMLAVNLSSSEEQKDALELLKKYSPNRNFKNKDGDTALMVLLKEQHGSPAIAELVQQLANEETDVMLKDKNGNLPLHVAVEKISDPGRREQVWEHLVATMQAVIPPQSMTIDEFSHFLKNKEGFNPLGNAR